MYADHLMFCKRMYTFFQDELEKMQEKAARFVKGSLIPETKSMTDIQLSGNR